MAIDLVQIAASAADARAAIAGVSLGSAGTRRVESDGMPNASSANIGLLERNPAAVPPDDGYLATKIDYAHAVEKSDDTTFSYERDEKDGQIYFEVKDTRSGKELYRIPKNLHAGMDPQPAPRPKVDVRV